MAEKAGETGGAVGRGIGQLGFGADEVPARRLQLGEQVAPVLAPSAFRLRQKIAGTSAEDHVERGRAGELGRAGGAVAGVGGVGVKGGGSRGGEIAGGDEADRPALAAREIEDGF